MNVNVKYIYFAEVKLRLRGGMSPVLPCLDL
jgi:hypothetical protein